MKTTDAFAKWSWLMVIFSMGFLTVSCVMPDSSGAEKLIRNSGEERFYGVFKNHSSPAGGSLNDLLQIDYPMTSDAPTHMELRPCSTGIEAVSYVGHQRRNYQILIKGNGYKYSAGKLEFGVSSYRNETKFFLSNSHKKVSTQKSASLDSRGNLVFTLKTVETGMNWFVPTIGGSVESFVFDRIR